MVPLFRGISTFQSLILSHHSRFTCENNKEDMNYNENGRQTDSWVVQLEELESLLEQQVPPQTLALKMARIWP